MEESKPEFQLRRGYRVTIYLPADSTKQAQIIAYDAVMDYLARRDSRLPLLGYSVVEIAGGFRESVEEPMEPDVVHCVTVEDWKPPQMTRQRFLAELRTLRTFIHEAYVKAGCPQRKILITVEKGAAQIT